MSNEERIQLGVSPFLMIILQALLVSWAPFQAQSGSRLYDQKQQKAEHASTISDLAITIAHASNIVNSTKLKVLAAFALQQQEKETTMSQQKKPPVWHRFLHSSNHATNSPPLTQNDLPEIKIITENSLKIESILMEEFRYRGDVVKQISNDATSSFNLYFLFLGISISGISVLYNSVDKTLSSAQVLTILFCFVLGIGNTLFFVRFISIIHVYERHKTVMNTIREYYIKHLQSQMPDMRSVFYIPLEFSFPFIYAFLLFSIFAILDCLCFTGAVFVLTELWFNIHLSTLLTLPSAFYPYIVAGVVCIFILIFHIQFYRLTVYKNRKMMQEVIAQQNLI